MAAGPTIVPALRYRDAHGAIEFLTDALGFEAHAIHEAEDGTVDHAELTFDDAMVMLGTAPQSDDPELLPQPPGGSSVYIVVEDSRVDEICEHAASLGAEIVREPYDAPYGGRHFTARDPEGNYWSFGGYDPFAAGE